MPKHLEKLLAKRAKKAEDMKALLAGAEKEDRALTKEEGEKYDEMEKELDGMSVDIQRVERQIQIDKDLDSPQRGVVGGEQRIDNQEDADKEIALYGRAFWKAQKGEVLSADEARSLNTGTDAKGGYLVPESFAATIIMKLGEKSYIRDVANVSTSTSTENLPVEGDDGASTWVDEEGAYGESDPTIAQVIMEAWKAGRIVKVTDEALQDTVPAVEDYVATKFTKSTTKLEEAAFVSGDGVKKPTGFLVTAETGVTAASTTAFTADEIIDLEYSLDEDYEQNAMWCMNKNTKKLIRKLKDADGNYLWKQGFNGEPDTLDGYPILTNKHMPDVAAGTSPIAFGDFGYYYIKDRLVMNIKRLDEKYADTGHVGFRVDKRVDGKLVLAEAIQKMVMAAV